MSWRVLLHVVAAGVDSVLAVLLMMKAYAYLHETVWFAFKGRQLLLPAYRADRDRSYEKDRLVGRPLPVVRLLHDPSRPSLWRTAGQVAIKTPVLIVAAAGLSLIVGAWAPAFASMAVAIGLSAILTFASTTVLTMHLVLGPYDALNPDLKMWSRLRARLYESSSPMGLYILSLIVLMVIGFSSVYANVDHSVASAFAGGQSLDPIRWIYFTLTVSSTVGFGDISASSNVGRVFVMLHMSAGSILLTWALSVVLGDKLHDQPQPATAPTVVATARRSRIKLQNSRDASSRLRRREIRRSRRRRKDTPT